MNFLKKIPVAFLFLFGIIKQGGVGGFSSETKIVNICINIFLEDPPPPQLQAAQSADIVMHINKGCVVCVCIPVHMEKQCRLGMDDI